MAKRRTLSAPSAEELAAIEQEVSGTRATRPVAPIAQVAGDAARAGDVASAEVRAERAKNAADAQRLKQAEEQGLVLTEIGVDAIDADAIVRDRVELDEEEMLELRLSISKNGLRLPIEVFELAEPDGKIRYGLLSGYRRLIACRALAELGRTEFGSVKCVVRAPEGVDQAYVAMVEENEVRAALTPFERGRVAVIAAGQGAFLNVHEAVDRLFESASKAKRSKIRSFALVFEDLGDMLTFPEELSEARGLALASALQAGAQAALREALDGPRPLSKDEEWSRLEAVISGLGEAAKPVGKGGRPRKSIPSGMLTTSSGYKIQARRQGSGVVIEIEGPHLHEDLIGSLASQLQHLLEKP